jgi:hypothetical protein
MKDSLSVTLGCLIMIILLCVVAFFFEFLFRLIEMAGLFFSGPAAPYLMKAFWFTLAVEFFIIIPISFIPNCKEICAKIIYNLSFFFGFITWIWGFVAAYFIWGKTGIIVGMLFFGVGVVPVGFLAALFDGQWLALAFIAVGLILTFGTRAIGLKISEDLY